MCRNVARVPEDSVHRLMRPDYEHELWPLGKIALSFRGRLGTRSEFRGKEDEVWDEGVADC